MSKTDTVQSAQYLTFGLHTDQFAIDVSKAREILDFANLTKVPQAPKYMLGVLNLRGSVVPVIDLRLKFGLPLKERTKESCYIVVEVNYDGELLTIGALVDSVSEVVDIRADQIEPPPRIGTKLDNDFIQGMGNLGEKFVIILDIDKVFSADELEFAQGIEEETEAVV